MKIFSLVLLMLSFASLNVLAQKSLIDGTIVDNESGEGIPFASIVIKNANDGSLVKGAVSDNAGNFEIKGLNKGSYNVSFSFIGYVTDSSRLLEINQQSSIIKLGNIALSISTVNLDEVEIKALAKTSSNKIDRKVYRATDFETAKGGTASDLLNKLPSVSISPDGEVSIRGTSDFLVYLNGKATLMDPSMFLAQLSSDAIESIEVINVPTAKYDAQGKGGIININTIANSREGLSASGNILMGGAPWGNFTTPYDQYSQNDNRYGGGLNLVYVKDRLSIHGSVYYNHRNVNGRRTGDARLLQEDGSYYHMVASGERPEWFENYSTNIGFKYETKNKGILSGSYYYGKRTEGRSAFYVYNNFYADINKEAISGIATNDDWIYNPNTDNRYGISHVASIDYSKNLNETSILNLSALYEHAGLSRILSNQNYDFKPSTNMIGNIEEYFQQTDNTPLDGIRLSIDYKKELDNGHSIEVGFQPQYLNQEGGFTYDTLNVNSTEWAAYTSLENAINLTRGIYASYVEYTGNMGDLSYLAGLRLEYTDQALEIENPAYFTIFERTPETVYEVNQLDWFPSLHMNYKLSEKNNLTLAASRRISRPPTKNMAPFLYRRHYEVYVVGDPSLKPEYLNNLELSYDQDFGKQNINLTGFYRGTNNAIFRVNTVYEEENVLIRSYTNSGNTTALGAELNANFIAGENAKFFIGGSLYNFNIGADIFGYQENNSSTNWSLKGNMNLSLIEGLKFNMDFNMKSATVTAQGRNEFFYYANAALIYTPTKLDGWDISLKVLDFLSSNNTGLNTRVFDTNENQIFFQETEYIRQGPIAELTISKAFNYKSKSSKKLKSTFGKEQF